jgi:rare lipoprotein A
MIETNNGRRGQVVYALVAAAMLCSVPAKADTPHTVQALPTVVPAIPDEDFATPAVPVPQVEAAESYEQVGEGEASYYGNELAGNRTASGERFNPQALTAAHRTLPMGSKLRVTNQSNGKTVIVRVNDRGPFTHRRVLDLSLAAAKRIDMFRAGKARVKMELLR